MVSFQRGFVGSDGVDWDRDLEHALATNLKGSPLTPREGNFFLLWGKGG